MPDEPARIEAVAPTDGVRLDVFVAALCPPLTREGARDWILGGRVGVEGRPFKPSLWLRAGDRVWIDPAPALAPEAEPEDLPLPVVYRDTALVVVDKPAGMATHPGPGWWHGSALNALLFHQRDWAPINGVATPGVVHRLDRDTSGLLIFANGDRAHRALLEAMRTRRVRRRYLALVEGPLAGAGSVREPLDRDPERPERVIVTPTGKPAVTHWRVLGPPGDRSLVELVLETGRTHQIRVHLAHLGHPIVGDPWYGHGGDEGLKLHAACLEFQHPLAPRFLSLRSRPPWAPDPPP